MTYVSPRRARHLFGRLTDEPEMGLNGAAVFGFCVWLQAHGKGDAEVRDGIVNQALVQFSELLELHHLILRRRARAQEEGSEPRGGIIEGPKRGRAHDWDDRTGQLGRSLACGSPAELPATVGKSDDVAPTCWV
jgi:hypothetical protein